MAFPTKETERLHPNNISDVGLKDEDSGLRLFRGMMSPWDQIKSFKETYNFLVRHSSLMAVGVMHSMRIIIPDYEQCQSMMSGMWAAMMDATWTPETGQLQAFEERFDVPPFMRDGVTRAALYCDKGDEMTLIPGHIWYISNDRFEKEIHVCAFDIAGPEGYEWEGWGPTGATWTAGEMYKDFNGCPMCCSYIAIDVIRRMLPSEQQEMAWRVVRAMFEACGKFQFGEANIRKTVREWMGVSADVDDGRVMGGYISMILQARDIDWKFLQFEPERTVVECDKFKFIMMGMYQEFTIAYEAYFNGVVKTLVAAPWCVTMEDDDANGKLRFTIEKKAYGFRRQKPNLHDYEKPEEKKAGGEA